MEIKKYIYVECRSLGHEWTKKSLTHAGDGLINNILKLSCLRCGTTRHDGVSVSGAVMARDYNYPEGYSLRMFDSPGRNEFRKEMIRRWTSTA